MAAYPPPSFQARDGMPGERVPGLPAVVGHHDQHQPPPPRHQLGHQHPHLLLPQLAVQAGVQKGLRQTMKGREREKQPL